jgi:hypothetical protein
MVLLPVRGLVTQAIKIPSPTRIASRPKVKMGNDFFIRENYREGGIKRQ